MISRRDMLKTGAAAAAALSAPRLAFAQEALRAQARRLAQFRGDHAARTARDRQGPGLDPLPSVREDEWISSPARIPADQCRLGRGESAIRNMGPRCCMSSSQEGETAPHVEVSSSSRCATAPGTRQGRGAGAGRGRPALYLEATELMPTDGIVKETAETEAAGKRRHRQGSRHL